MVEELDRLVDYLNEADCCIARSGETLESLDAIPLALERMIDGQRDLGDGISRLNENGIMVMEENRIDAVNKSRAGKAQMGQVEIESVQADAWARIPEAALEIIGRVCNQNFTVKEMAAQTFQPVLISTIGKAVPAMSIC